MYTHSYIHPLSSSIEREQDRALESERERERLAQTKKKKKKEMKISGKVFIDILFN